MKEFLRTSLPAEIKYNKKVYTRNMDLSNKHTLHLPFDKKGCIMVKVLSRNLRGKSDLHNRPYRPTEWIFKANF